MNAFSLFYLLLLGFVWILATPYLLYLTYKKKYRQSIPARFFLWKNLPFKNNNIWFHGCSFGEVKSFTPFTKELHVDITTTTNTGFSEAKRLSENVRFLPFEIFLPFWIKHPKVLVVSEAELWYMLFLVAKLKGAKVLLINARISDKSYKSYKKFAWFYKKIFANIDKVFAQSEKDRQRLKTLGAKNIEVNGNIKTASIPKPTREYKKPNRRVITLASSHENEEELVLQNLLLQKNDMLIIVPRHPERFLHVRNLIEKFGQKNSLTCRAFSQDGFCECDILLCDTLGELINIYAITDITLLGGSFVDKIGGHNPLECAYFGNILISGEYAFNQKALFALVQNAYFSQINQINELLNQDLKPSSLHVKDTIAPIIKEIKAK